MGDQQIVESPNPIEVVGRRDSLRRHSESKNQCQDREGRRAAKKPVTPCGSPARDKAANGIDSLLVEREANPPHPHKSCLEDFLQQREKTVK
jgi:hypothetical protein